MKLQNSVAKPELSNTVDHGVFKIKSSAKAFSILSSGLYSNKIKAIVRELSCNAIDSHAEAGTLDIPFEVHLPNQLDPYFSVRDYGLGLDHDEVLNIYTTYFESTKTDSNDYIGALGLGSKSPFSYTDNFSITAIKDGVKRVYTAYINDDGCPAVAKMYEGPVCMATADEKDKRNGVEVKFSVTDRYDISSFCTEAIGIYKWFEHKPVVKGNSSYTEKSPDYDVEELIPGVSVLTSQGYSTRHKSYALQGNILYPIELPDSPQYEEYQYLLRERLLLRFDIGELDIAASREELSYIEMTCNNIVEKLKLVKDGLREHLYNALDSIEDEWERVQEINSRSRTTLFGKLTREYVAAGRSKLASYKSGSHINFSRKFIAHKLINRGLNVKMYEVSQYGYGTRVKVKEQYCSSTYMDPRKQFEINFLEYNEFYILDENIRGLLKKLRHENSSFRGRKMLYVFAPDNETKELNYKEIHKFLRRIYVDYSSVMRTSTLEKPPVQRNTTFRAGFMEYNLHDVGRAWYSSETEWKWDRIETEFNNDPSKTYYYVPLDNTRPLDKYGNQLSYFTSSFWKDVLDLKLFKESEKLYGVRKSKIKSVLEYSNWVNVNDYLLERVQKFDMSDAMSDVYTNIVNNDIFDTDLVNKVNGINDGEFKKLVLDIGDAVKTRHTRSTSKITKMKRLANRLGHDFDVDISKMKDDFRTRYDEVMDSYPLLAYLRYTPTSLVVDYINIMEERKKQSDE